VKELMIRILIVDDQALIRDGLRSLLEAQPDLQVVGDAEHGADALDQIQTLVRLATPPDIVLLDIRMPVMDGVAATQQITAKFPNIRVLILTTFDDEEYVSQAIRYGAKGYLLKDTPSKDLAIAIRSVHEGYTYLGPGLMAKALTSRSIPASMPENNDLTPREQEVLALLCQGAENREIATALFISERTVKNHITNILTRLGLKNRTQAALWAQKNQ
jgi:DNA-binding NarL/FixJ family response regulator